MTPPTGRLAVAAPPPTPAEDRVELLHGHRVADPYRWLEDGEAPAVRAWDDAQTERTRDLLDGLAARGSFRARLTALLDVPVVLGATVAGTRLFTLERGAGHDQVVLAVGDGAAGSTSGARPTVLVDPAALLGDPTAALDWYHPSPDGRRVAIGLSTGGDELSTLRIVEVATGELLADTIPRTRAAAVAWRADGSGFAYTRYPDPSTVPDGEAGYHRSVHEHQVGRPTEEDVPLFTTLPDPAAWPDVRSSEDDRWVLVHVSVGWDRTDVHLLDRTDGSWRTVISGVEALTDLRVVGDRLIGVTTLDAPTGRVVEASLEDPSPGSWTDLVPASDAVIESVVPTAASLLVISSHRAVSRVSWLPRPDVGSPDGHPPRPLALPADGTVFTVTGSRERDEAFVGFTSFAHPPALLRWDGEGLAPWASPADDGPAALDPTRYVVEDHRYPSSDGTPITLFTLRRDDVAPGPDTPTILSGYGGFGVTMSPGYSADAVAHADAGGVWAVACIRGGSEEGEDWHRAGQGAGRPQVLADLEAAADWLVAEGRTSAAHLALRGGSNGGLLVTAVLVRRPDLAAAVHAAVPLCDMVRFPRFRIARLWVPEYGDPDRAEDLAWLLSYSPYHRVVDGTPYPAVLVTTGAEDSRVDPLHARKVTARLQAATEGVADAGPILLRVERGAGHGQGKPSSRRAEEGADVLAFLHAVIAPPG